MPFYPIYSGQFKNVEEQLYQVDILEDTPTPGSVKELIFEEPFLVLEKPQTDDWAGVWSGGATIHVWNTQDDDFLSEVLYGQAMTYRVDVIDVTANRLIFQGWIEPTLPERNYEAIPYGITLTAGDGLKILQEISPNFDSISDQINLRDLLYYLLSFTQLPTAILLEQSSLETDESGNTDPMLSLHFPKSGLLHSTFTDATVYDVLDGILKIMNWRICQGAFLSTGVWFFLQRYLDLVPANASKQYPAHDPAGSFTTWNNNMQVVQVDSSPACRSSSHFIRLVEKRLPSFKEVYRTIEENERDAEFRSTLGLQKFLPVTFDDNSFYIDVGETYDVRKNFVSQKIEHPFTATIGSSDVLSYTTLATWQQTAAQNTEFFLRFTFDSNLYLVKPTVTYQPQITFRVVDASLTNSVGSIIPHPTLEGQYQFLDGVQQSFPFEIGPETWNDVVVIDYGMPIGDIENFPLTLPRSFLIWVDIGLPNFILASPDKAFYGGDVEIGLQPVQSPGRAVFMSFDQALENRQEVKAIWNTDLDYSLLNNVGTAANLTGANKEPIQVRVGAGGTYRQINTHSGREQAMSYKRIRSQIDTELFNKDLHTPNFIINDAYLKDVSGNVVDFVPIEWSWNLSQATHRIVADEFTTDESIGEPGYLQPLARQLLYGPVTKNTVGTVQTVEFEMKTTQEGTDQELFDVLLFYRLFNDVQYTTNIPLTINTLRVYVGDYNLTPAQLRQTGNLVFGVSENQINVANEGLITLNLHTGQQVGFTYEQNVTTTPDPSTVNMQTAVDVNNLVSNIVVAPPNNGNYNGGTGYSETRTVVSP